MLQAGGNISPAQVRTLSATRPLRERFEEKYIPVPESGCWLWTAATSKAGYGVIGVFCKKIALAHRLSWEFHRGPIPVGMDVCHKCDTPSCINPDHLFLGTHKENMHDMIRKGRRASTRGEHCGMAKLTKEQAVFILGSSAKSVDLARLYGVSESTIFNVRHRTTWAWLDKPTNPGAWCPRKSPQST